MRHSQLEDYVQEQYSLFLVAGIADVGKTELLKAFDDEQARALGGVLRLTETLDEIPQQTVPDSMRCFPVKSGRRRLALVDASGEYLRRLYPYPRPSGSFDRKQLEPIGHIARRLGGLVLVFDLKKLWDPHPGPGWDRQIEILTWIVSLVRWLRHGPKYPEAMGGSFEDWVNRTLLRQRRRLRQPVLVLFSKADELEGVQIPQSADPVLYKDGAERRLEPLAESPLELARRHLPGLYAALALHCHHFRFDFVRSQVQDLAREQLVRSAWGVKPSFDWLLDTSWRWPGLGTSRWIALGQRFDRGRRQPETCFVEPTGERSDVT